MTVPTYVIVDLAPGRFRTLKSPQRPQCEAVDPDTGNGYSVLDVVEVSKRQREKIRRYRARNSTKYSIDGSVSGDVPGLE
jgi:UDP-glucose 4-epimerase